MITKVYSPNIMKCALRPASLSLWKTTEVIRVEFKRNGVLTVLHVPTGTVSNLGTVPPILRSLITTGKPKQSLPFCVHDYLVNEFNQAYVKVTWSEATVILCALLKQLCEHPWRIALIRFGVSLHGLLRKRK